MQQPPQARRARWQLPLLGGIVGLCLCGVIGRMAVVVEPALTPTALSKAPTITPRPTVAPTQAVARPTAIPSAIIATVAPLRPLADVIRFGRASQITRAGDQVTVQVLVINADQDARSFDVQANFYSVALKDLGNDPADHLLTAGFTPVVLTAGEQRTVTITAQNNLPDPVVSADFTATGGP